MSKVTLSYELDIYEDSDLFETISNAVKTKAVIEEFDQWLKSKIKYGTSPSDWPQLDALGPDVILPEYNEYILEHIFSKCRKKLGELLYDAY